MIGEEEEENERCDVTMAPRGVRGLGVLAGATPPAGLDLGLMPPEEAEEGAETTRDTAETSAAESKNTGNCYS